MSTSAVTPVNKYLSNVIPADDNVWNTDYENIIISLSNKAKGYRYVYTEAINYYTILYNWIYWTQGLLSWGALVIQAIYTALSGAGIGVNPVGFNIAIALLIFFSNGLTQLLTKLTLTTKINSCNRISQDCVTFFTNLDVLLTLPQTVRIPPYNAIQMAQSDYNTLMTTMNSENISLPQDIIDKYITDSNNTDFISEIVNDAIPTAQKNTTSANAVGMVNIV